MKDQKTVVDARVLDGISYACDMHWAMIHDNEALARVSLALDGKELTEENVSEEVFALSQRAQARILAQQENVRAEEFSNPTGKKPIELREYMVPMDTGTIHNSMMDEVRQRVENYDPAQNGGRVIEFIRKPQVTADYSDQSFYGPGTGFDLGYPAPNKA